MENKSLYHHGILGMKWGVRRTPEQLGHRTAKSRDKTHVSNPDKKKKREIKTASKNRRLLSEQDLRSRIERLKLEKQLKELTREEVEPGKAFVADVLASSGKKVAGALVTGAVLYGVKSAMTKNFDIKEAAAYMTPKPKNK